MSKPYVLIRVREKTGSSQHTRDVCGFARNVDMSISFKEVLDAELLVEDMHKPLRGRPITSISIRQELAHTTSYPRGTGTGSHKFLT
jgi:hypothetical protein